MSSLADLPELVGFFSYSRRDDEHSGGALSRLRARIYDELRLQLGRDVRLWQDAVAIPHGTLWEDELKRAIAKSAFFIPIVTPSAVTSSHCRTEFELFLAREARLERKDLIFPILYIRVPGLASDDQRRQSEVLEIIHARQYADWTKIRQHDVASFDVSKQIERFCEDIVEALRHPWLSPEERQRAEDTEARRKAAQEQRYQEEVLRRKIADEAEHHRIEAEAAAKREAEERARQAAVAQAERQRKEREAAATREAEQKARQEEQQKKEENERVERSKQDGLAWAGQSKRRLEEKERGALNSPAFRAIGALLILMGGMLILLTTLFIIGFDKNWYFVLEFLVAFFIALGLTTAGLGLFIIGAHQFAQRVGFIVCLGGAIIFVVVFLAGNRRWSLSRHLLEWGGS